MIDTFAIGVGLLVLGMVIGVVLARLFGSLSALEKRVKELEDCKTKRLPYNTAAGVEDAQAVGIDLLMQAQEMQVQAQALELRAKQQMEILGLVRQGPEAYDPERPAGRRPGAHHGATEGTEK